MADLSPRAKQILYACITEFVATGEPVGSRTLSKRAGIELSPASIRNVLSDLEELGYLHQPHTSAGRIPTDKAFRLFIDAMMEVRELTHAENALLLQRFSTIEPGPNFLRETGKLLSELTGTAAVVVSPKHETLTLKHLRFIRTLPGEILAVVVMAILTILGPQVGNVFSRVVDGLGVASSGGGGGSSSAATVTSIAALRGGADVGVNITVSANTNVTVTDSQSGQSVSVGCNSACSVTLTAVGPNAGTVTATADGGSSQSANYPSE